MGSEMCIRDSRFSAQKCLVGGQLNDLSCLGHIPEDLEDILEIIGKKAHDIIFPISHCLSVRLSVCLPFVALVCLEVELGDRLWLARVYDVCLARKRSSQRAR